MLLSRETNVLLARYEAAANAAKIATDRYEAAYYEFITRLNGSDEFLAMREDLTTDDAAISNYLIEAERNYPLLQERRRQMDLAQASLDTIVESGRKELFKSNASTRRETMKMLRNIR